MLVIIQDKPFYPNLLLGLCLLGSMLTSALTATASPNVLPMCTQKAVTVNDKSMQMFFPDGQLTNRLLSVFISNIMITEDQKPVLFLLNQRTTDTLKDAIFTAKLVDFNQRWTHNQSINGETMAITEEGTLLVFDISSFDIPSFRPFMHATPVIQWHNKGDTCVQQFSLGKEQANLGNAVGIAFNSLLLLLAILLFITAVAARSQGGWWKVVHLLCEPNGKLSLSKVQMAVWTVVIVAVVYAFSLSKMAIPEIPPTLLLLMGASYATRAMVKWQGRKTTKQTEDNTPADTSEIIHNSPRLSHLICDSSGQLSLPRAQMLMWTVLSVVLFIMKSLLDGHMWHVPIELVALMGMSQLGYAIPSMNANKKSVEDKT